MFTVSADRASKEKVILAYGINASEVKVNGKALKNFDYMPGLMKADIALTALYKNWSFACPPPIETAFPRPWAACFQKIGGE